jgi:DNA-binding MarR family transcriptional regulator
VSLLFRMGERFLNRELTGSGVSSGPAPLLLELRDGKHCNLASLAMAAGVDKAYITRAVQSLERAGYVTVTVAAEDRRSIAVTLTGEGRAVVGRVEAAMHTWLAIVCHGVAQADLDTVVAVLDRFYANARGFLAEWSGARS